ncbi:unnamed protein product [Prunus armeniaca]|uniref:Zinc finger GRF-type domain-containing protein n=1 Tax=Prunus armeniaca TaxID=36596 RepID=A0A6J5ULX7_PRUAR|nr:unnamed protein product [Prunus armeniaca]
MSKSVASQAPKCLFCNGEMRIATSKTDKSRGRRFWKCNTSYVREHFTVLDFYGMMRSTMGI